MEKARMQEFEYKCIQEKPPWCSAACKLRESGGSIELGGLERACLDEGPLRRRPLLIPKSGSTVAVAGCGISSFSAASDGAKKGGYFVTVFCRSDRMSLLTALFPTVPEEVAREEFQWLGKQGVRFRPLDGFPTLQKGDKKPSAVCIGLDDPEAALLLGEGERKSDPVSLETAVPKVFSGEG